MGIVTCLGIILALIAIDGVVEFPIWVAAKITDKRETAYLRKRYSSEWRR